MTDTQPIADLESGHPGKPVGVAGSDGVVDIVRNEAVTRIVLGGDIDIVSIPRLRPVVEAACAHRSRTVVFDVSAVDFVDSHGLRLCVETHRRLTGQGRRLVFVPPPEHVWRVFVLTGLDEVFIVQPDA
jgi:anti-sigma B factor antagonist